MSNVAIYARKSTESEDRQVLSIDSQIQELRGIAERGNLGIPILLTESQSAKSPGRPVFNRLMTRVRRGEVDTILCWKLDRLARNPVDGGALIWAIEEKQLMRIVTPQNSFGNSGNDKFWMQMEFGMAKKYVDDLSDNVKRGFRTKLSRGWMPGRPPLGYLNDKDTKTIVQDPERFCLVRRMWTMLLSGNYAPNAICRIATTKWGFTSPKFKRTGGGPVAYSAVYKMFTNPFYYGKIVYRGQTYDGAHTPMISYREYERAQYLLGNRSKPRPQRHVFPFTGLIKCGECGASVTAEHKVNRQGHRYTYYHCTKRKRHVKCTQGVIEEKELEKQIVCFLGSISITRQMRDWAIRVIDDLEREDRATMISRQESLNTRLTSIGHELDELLNMKLRGLISDEEFTSKKDRLSLERLQLDQELKSGSVPLRNTAAGVFDLAYRAVSAFKKGSPESKKAILHQIGSNLTLRDKILSIRAYKPFEVIRNNRPPLQPETVRFEPSVFDCTQPIEASDGHQLLRWQGVVKEVRTWCQEHRYEFTFASLPSRKKCNPQIPEHQD